MADVDPEDEAAAQELLTLLGEVHPLHIPEAPPVLYHYTTAAGLAGIVSSGHFRGTNYSFLNDARELRYGVDLVLKRFEAEARRREKDDRISLMLGVGGEVWMEKQASLAETYVSCFTELRDDLNQWRGYGGGVDRYCIGISVEALTAMSRYSFAPVIYSRDEQDALLDEYFAVTANFLRERGEASEWLVISAMKILTRWLLESIPFLKDAHFASEREWRAVRNIESVQTDELFFESSGGTLRPYVRLYDGEADKLPIVEVIVQSARPDERASKAVKLLLARYGYSDTLVTDSEVPFRAV